jgi:hypothetical protein
MPKPLKNISEKKFSVDRHEFEFGNLANLLKVLGSEIKKREVVKL